MFNATNVAQENKKLFDNFFSQNIFVAEDETLAPKKLDLKLVSKNEDLVSFTNSTNNKNGPFQEQINDKIKNDTFKNMFYVDGINGRSKSGVNYLSRVSKHMPKLGGICGALMSKFNALTGSFFAAMRGYNASMAALSSVKSEEELKRKMEEIDAQLMAAYDEIATKMCALEEFFPILPMLNEVLEKNSDAGAELCASIQEVINGVDTSKPDCSGVKNVKSLNEKLDKSILEAFGKNTKTLFEKNCKQSEEEIQKCTIKLNAAKQSKNASQIGENAALINVYTKLLSFYKEFLQNFK